MFYANSASDASDYVTNLAKDRGVKSVVKSKSMISEEMSLNHHLEIQGIESVETDLGEFIIQLDHDAPSHIVQPMIHKDRRAVGRAFERELGTEYCEDATSLARVARKHLREKFRQADLGISGGNFLIAESGSVVICTNEGNGRLCTSAPRVHAVSYTHLTLPTSDLV